MTGTLLLAIGLVGYVAFGALALRAQHRASRSTRKTILLGIHFLFVAGLIAQDLFLPHPREELQLAKGLVLVLGIGTGVVCLVIVGSGPEPRTYAPAARAAASRRSAANGDG